MAGKKNNRMRSGILVCVCLLAVALGAFCCIRICRQQDTLTCTTYQIQASQLSEPLRVVHLSDLHNAEFGAGNADLLNLVREQSPDLVLLTGDLLNSDAPDTLTATELIRGLSRTAPVYLCLGNHELAHQEQFGADLTALYTSAGATVLEREYLDLEVRSQPVRLGGLYGYCLPEKYLDTGEAKQHEVDFLKQFQDTDRYTILLCHNPTAWLINGALDAWEADCVLAGHTHGGQIILPLIGGVYGPDLGFFPGRLEGLFHAEDGEKKLVLNRGLGSSVRIPRINNTPEIVVIDLLPPKE